MNNVKEFAKRVDKVKLFLDSQKLDFMVVGSGALLVHGLTFNRSPHDVDIEVRCEDESILKALSDAYGNKFYKIKEDYPEIGEHKPYIFAICGKNEKDEYYKVIVNAWAVKEFSHPYSVTYEGVKYAPVMSVLRRKILLGRIKDYKDLASIAKNIMNLLSLDKIDIMREIVGIKRKSSNEGTN